ncbi:T3SS (YopN, CesT) and YbjN peptide-binding chaperone 1 [Nocardioides zhouii]|uniref:Uncharacterized protein n=1 Tax=Nocardioides zhouii TaxID=1168729 RepID=A0A4Q2SX60_9ACTN|nr:hypothetical protein [Nocardioides zhouii]RYC10492.1 hypothetical protein EUA94_13280 [Nocardioides zhouii]
MNDELERRWDDTVETAWREFRQRLADRLAMLEIDDSVVIDTDPDEMAAPWCEVTLTGGILWVQVLANGDHDLTVKLEPREVDRAAVMVVEALRATYGVLHPIYLHADGLEPQALGEPAPQQEIDLTEATQPSSVDDVRAVIDLAVADVYDDAPQWDDDGDLGLPTEAHVVWASVNGHAPRVLLSCMLLDDVDDTESALVEINRLNRAEWGLTFTLHERRISVTRELGLGVALPLAVQGEIQRLLSQVDGWGRDLAERVRTGAESRSRDRSSGRFATAYAVMAELEREQRGSVGPAAMARIFGNDTGLLLKAIRITERRRRDMRTKARSARDEGRRTQEKLARARHDYLRDLAVRMRAGLRLIVDAPVRKVQADQLALFDEDEAGTSR